jgi:hypothetical protein
MNTKNLTIGELQTIAEACVKLSNAHPTPAIALKIARWAKPFLDEAKEIMANRNEIAKKFIPVGEEMVPKEKEREYMKAQEDYTEETKEIKYKEFDMTWLDGVSVTGIAVLSLVLPETE